MVRVEIIDLIGGEQLLYDGLFVDRAESHRLEFEQFAEGRFAAVYAEQVVLDTDAVAAFDVETGLIRGEHAGLQGHSGRAPVDALRSLVDAQQVADAVTCAVAVVQPVLPESHMGQYVQIGAAAALGELYLCQIYITLEHEGIVQLHLIGQRADRDRTGDTSRVEVRTKRDDIDLSVIMALYYRGGGHLKSAGGVLSITPDVIKLCLSNLGMIHSIERQK